MSTYTESDLQEAYERGFSAGRYQQYREDRERFEAETQHLRAWNENILKHVAALLPAMPVFLEKK